MESQKDGAVRRALLQKLESLQRSGVAQLSRPTALSDLAQPVGQLTSEEDEVETMVDSPAGNQASQLAIIRKEVEGCTKCRELATTRTQTVFGIGNPDARLCFLGEAPGADEDRQGEPFVGRAGQLLTKIIEACTLKREDVYILNILKCRPPGNRNPSSEEAENCGEFLHRQFDVIQPEYICCLGSIAATNLLQTTEPIGKLRGRFHLYRGIKVLATYHPAYLLRNPPAKRQVWDDMKLLMNEMGIGIPSNNS